MTRNHFSILFKVVTHANVLQRGELRVGADGYSYIGDGTGTREGHKVYCGNRHNQFINNNGFQVQYNQFSFPIFDPHVRIDSATNSRCEVEIQYTGDRNEDYRLAEQTLRLDDCIHGHGWTWHHKEVTYDNNGQNRVIGFMQLIPTNVHKSICHEGGFSHFSKGYR